MTETWKAVSGWPYEVSSLGRVRRTGSDDCLSIYTKRNGYKVASLSKNGEAKTVLVHHLVLEAFVGPRPEGHQTNHINGVPGDNRPENLEWVTPEENIAHAIETNLIDATLDPEDVRTIRNLRREKGWSWTQIARHVGANPWTVQSAGIGVNWSRITDPPPVPRSKLRSQKLSESDAQEIRYRYENEDVTQEELGREYGVHYTTIGNVVRGDTFTDSDPKTADA